MTNPDYRAMCAELVAALAEWRIGGGPPEDTADADLIDRARALLAQPTPQPVAVSERLPGDVLSWWYEPDEDDDEGYGGKWTLLRIRGAAYTYTHWLPAYALPTPEATND